MNFSLTIFEYSNIVIPRVSQRTEQLDNQASNTVRGEIMTGLDGQTELIRQNLSEMFDGHEHQIDRAVRSLKVMAHPLRLKILCLLRNGEFHVQAMEQYTNLPQATISRHLSLLKDRGLVECRRDGNFSYYRIANDKVVELFDLISQLFC